MYLEALASTAEISSVFLSEPKLFVAGQAPAHLGGRFLRARHGGAKQKAENGSSQNESLKAKRSWRSPLADVTSV